MNDVGKSTSQQPVSTGSVMSGVETQSNPVSTLPTREGQPVEVIRPTDPEIELHPELREAGVEVTPENPVIPEEAIESAPVVAPPPSVPVGADNIPQATPIPVLPMTQREAHKAAAGSIDDTGTWFGSLVLRLCRRIHER